MIFLACDSLNSECLIGAIMARGSIILKDSHRRRAYDYKIEYLHNLDTNIMPFLRLQLATISLYCAETQQSTLSTSVSGHNSAKVLRPNHLFFLASDSLTQSAWLELFWAGVQLSWKDSHGRQANDYKIECLYNLDTTRSLIIQQSFSQTNFFYHSSIPDSVRIWNN